jgi:hypothetical protein
MRTRDCKAGDTGEGLWSSSSLWQEALTLQFLPGALLPTGLYQCLQENQKLTFRVLSFSSLPQTQGNMPYGFKERKESAKHRGLLRKTLQKQGCTCRREVRATSTPALLLPSILAPA